MSDEVEEQIDNLAFLCVSRPWPGRNGARAARVLCTVLRRVASTGYRSLSLDTDLYSLAIDAGLAKGTGVQDALRALESEGWIHFTLGEPLATDDDGNRKGKPSHIALIAKRPSGRSRIKWTPLPTLDVFNDDETGHAGWLAVARWKFESSRDRVKPFTMKEIERMTGMTYDRIKDLMPKMVQSALARKDAGKYVFTNMEYTTERDPFDITRYLERLEKLEADRKTRMSEEEIKWAGTWIAGSTP